MITYLCQDSVEWLRNPAVSGNIVTSMPDGGEMGWELAQWKKWFFEASRLCLAATCPSCVTIFFQTDRKSDGQWVDKSHIIQSAADIVGSRLLWHKIVLRRDVGKCDLFRPVFSHLLAFSKQARSGKATPDVFPVGRMIYEDAMPLNVARFAVETAIKCGGTIVDPFCGRGTIPALAHALGASTVIGIDIDPAQIEKARKLKISRST